MNKSEDVATELTDGRRIADKAISDREPVVRIWQDSPQVMLCRQ